LITSNPLTRIKFDRSSGCAAGSAAAQPLDLSTGDGGEWWWWRGGGETCHFMYSLLSTGDGGEWWWWRGGGETCHFMYSLMAARPTWFALDLSTGDGGEWWWWRGGGETCHFMYSLMAARPTWFAAWLLTEAGGRRGREVVVARWWRDLSLHVFADGGEANSACGVAVDGGGGETGASGGGGEAVARPVTSCIR